MDGKGLGPKHFWFINLKCIFFASKHFFLVIVGEISFFLLLKYFLINRLTKRRNHQIFSGNVSDNFYLDLWLKFSEMYSVLFSFYPTTLKLNKSARLLQWLVFNIFYYFCIRWESKILFLHYQRKNGLSKSHLIIVTWTENLKITYL